MNHKEPRDVFRVTRFLVPIFLIVLLSACGSPVEDCGTAGDEDGNGLSDCQDPACSAVPACAPETDCQDNVDNDGDGTTDCQDFDCANNPACLPEVNCNDNVDNDLDGDIDCADDDCAGTAACVESDCRDGQDNDLDGDIDCADSDCLADVTCNPEGNCQDGQDNDLDGQTDCADSDCFNNPICTALCGNGNIDVNEQCDDGNNADGDGCSSVCQIEFCGDGVINNNGTEQCDPPDGISCDDFCQKIPICGDGFLDVGEQCDDGNTDDDDGCSSVCQVENAGFDCLGNQTLVQISSTDVPKNIVDNQTLTSIVNVSGTGEGGVVAKVVVGLDNISHTFDGDLDIFLISPEGTSVELTTDNGGTGENFINTIFDDVCIGVNGSIVNGSAPFTGCFAPEGSLATMLGETPDGTWTLSVTDDADNDQGTLNAWTLGLCITFPTCGDGVLEIGEDCDPPDGVTCDDQCQRIPTCGDGFVDAGEECDPPDGNVTCDDQCQRVPLCGDGFVDDPEECDDTNPFDGDGCNSLCQLEFCGDGLVQPLLGEECDPPDGVTCDDQCKDIPLCGDGIVDFPETCDDGNTDDGDGCSFACQIEGAAFDCAEDQILVLLSSTDVPKTVLDNQTVLSTVDVVGVGGVVARAIVGIEELLHGFDADVDIFLISPAGTRVELSTDNGSSNDNYISTVLDDNCITVDGPIANGTPPYTGCFSPEFPLADLIGEDADGTWTLEVTDDAGGITGTLNAWRLGLCVAFPTCGDGVVEIGEDCDPPNGVTCDDFCKKIPICGDNFLDVGEQCDDGNTDNGDGCDEFCQFEVQVEIEPNGGVIEAINNGAFTPNVMIVGEINPVADKDFFAINVPLPADIRIETFDETGIGNCAAGHDTLVRLFDVNGSTELINDNDDGVGACSLIDPSVDAAARNLAPGTYFVSVEENGNNATIVGYTLVITFEAVCGNGIVESAEECDPPDGITCDDLCQRVPVCGDGFIDFPEECDDGNTDNGDGCDENCQIETFLESEPNDDGTPDLGVGFPGTNGNDFDSTNANGPFETDVVIEASLIPAGDEDVFAVTNTTGAAISVRLDTFNQDLGIGVPCGTTIDTAMHIRDAAGTSLASNDDRNGVADRCSGLNFTIQPGETVFAHITDFSDDGEIPGYFLVINFP